MILNDIKNEPSPALVFRLGELFCGAGGIGLGARLANSSKAQIEHIWATDYDKDACKTYATNLSPKKVICQDIRKLDFKKLKAVGEIDCLTFGFPCNDFSSVGEQKGLEGSFGGLYKECVKALAFFKPIWFIAENVSGIRNSNDGKAFLAIVSEFEAQGYKLYPHLYKFNEYGIPQKRHRIIIVGIREDINVDYKIPSSERYKHIDNSSRTALLNIPQDSPNNEFTKQSPTVIERLQHIREGQNAFNADLPAHLRLNVKGAKISQIYKRLKADEPSYTITGSGGGGTHVYHWSEDRALTNRERARLQTFTDDFVFEGSKESVRKQIGMAVPPAGSKIVFESIMRSFLGESYPSVSSNINIERTLQHVLSIAG